CGMPMKYCQPISTTAESTMARMVFLLSIMSGALSRARMWGGGRTLATMNGAQGPREILDQPLKREAEGGPPPDQDVVVSWLQPALRRAPDHVAQPAPHPVPLDRVADLLGNGKPH